MNWPNPTPIWVTEGLEFVGLREIPGKQHNPTILRWLLAGKAWWKEDETPWCGTFVHHCLVTAGITPPKHWYRAKAYADFGEAVAKSAHTIPLGAICVKSRKGGGHVFIAVAKSADGKTIYGLGGNQGNRVSIVGFPISEIDAVRWPGGGATRNLLPVANAGDVGAVPRGSEA